MLKAKGVSLERPRSLHEAFDLTTSEIVDSEVDTIREAVFKGKLRIDPHALDAALDDGLGLDDIKKVIMEGQLESKDLPGNPNSRKPGINFVGTLADSSRVNVKVSWLSGYNVVTVYRLQEKSDGSDSRL